MKKRGIQMKNFLNKIIILIVLICSISTNVRAHLRPDDVSFTDYCGMISDGIKDYVKSKNDILFEQTEAKIIFVTTNSTDGLSVNEYAKNLYSSWNVGNIGRGNSVFIVIASDSNDYGVVQGKNIKRILNDSILYEIIAETFEPEFAKGNYDKAVFNLYNSLGKWYEEHYSNLDLKLSKNISGYISSQKTKDIDKEPPNILMWIGIGVVLVMIIIFFNIKRNVDFKTRQSERRIKRKRNKADIDKIVNS